MKKWSIGIWSLSLTIGLSLVPAIIFFSKDRRVNENDAKGYYGEFTFKNNSRDKVELFATACQISESSK